MPREKGKKMKKAIVTTVVAALVLGVGLAGYTYCKQKGICIFGNQEDGTKNGKGFVVELDSNPSK
jgi:hypothetical protein